jgi:glutaminase
VGTSLQPFTFLTQQHLENWVAQAGHKGHVGQVPTYIPQLATVNRDLIAIAVRLSTLPPLNAGSLNQQFVLMSVIKPFVLLFLLEHLGQQAVFERVGVQPSELPFHSLAQLTADRGFPRNPMINSGAIALADLLPGGDGRLRCAVLCDWLNRLSGSRLALDEAMLASVQSLNNETNLAIANMLLQSDYLNSTATALDTYNHICCLAGTIDDLAKLGLLLAHPQSAIAPFHQRVVNAIMLTCGLYETSSTVAVQIGVPIKSGVSGALLAIVPRQGAIACYSPPLDESGTSVAGLWLIEQIVDAIDLSLFG